MFDINCVPIVYCKSEEVSILCTHEAVFENIMNILKENPKQFILRYGMQYLSSVLSTYIIILMPI